MRIWELNTTETGYTSFFLPKKVEQDIFETKIYEDYHVLHIYNYIEAMDKKKSEYEINYGGGYDVNRFRLDEKKLKDIPLEERLVFYLEESPSCLLFHESIVNKITQKKFKYC